MQSYTADNDNNNDQFKVLPIWRRVLIYFRQFANVLAMAQLVISSASLRVLTFINARMLTSIC